MKMALFPWDVISVALSIMFVDSLSQMTEEKRFKQSQEIPKDMEDRYSRQIRLDEVGIEGQVMKSRNSK